MLFNSSSFLLFFPAVCAIYFALPPKHRWWWLLLASYYFYASWKPGYLLLIVASTVVDYLAALRMSQVERGARRWWLGASLCVNLGLLFTFKYFDFFAASLEHVMPASLMLELPRLDLLLPVGISFYTFQTLSYTIDVYRGELEPERHFGRFALFVAFFPQLVAGPIERAARLLPQFQSMTARWDVARVHAGFEQMLRGFVKKTCIADRAAIYVDIVYANPGAYSTGWLLAATYLFALQIYCDFSGYSDIAIGAARVMGFELSENFRRPYFATSFSDFWRRWHISLSTFFRDYVYIPLGGNRTGAPRRVFNVFVTFVVSGLWHGANWTFVVWGALHGIYLALERLVARFWPGLLIGSGSRVNHLVRVAVVFHLVLVAWVFFRAANVGEAFEIIGRIFGIVASPEVTTTPQLPGVWLYFGPQAMLFEFLVLAMVVTMLLLHELRREEGVETTLSRMQRWAAYGGLITLLLFVGRWGAAEFIYFQF